MTERSVKRISVCAVLLVAFVAAVCSYAHLYDLALLHGEGWRANLIPLSVDGMLVAATLAIVGQRRQGRPAGWVPWLGLVVGILASLLGNVAAAHADLIARLIAGWPPAALAISIETLVVILRGPTPAEIAEVPEPALTEDLNLEPQTEPRPEKKPALTAAERAKAYRDRKKQEQQERQLAEAA